MHFMQDCSDNALHHFTTRGEVLIVASQKSHGNARDMNLELIHKVNEQLVMEPTTEQVTSIVKTTYSVKEMALTAIHRYIFCSVRCRYGCNHRQGQLDQRLTGRNLARANVFTRNQLS